MALAHDGPAVVQAVVDPNEPPMPENVSTEQMIKFSEALLKGQPDVFFIPPHYDGYLAVLVRLEVVDLQQLAELVEDAWRLRAPKRLVAEHDAATTSDH